MKSDMTTSHQLICSDSRQMPMIEDESVDLVVTSPPYPMIEMWDPLFSGLSEEVEETLLRREGDRAFELMHRELDKAWAELRRVLKNGGFACINVGDAARTIGERFRLYPNHSRVVSSFQAMGFDVLPVILWRKQTNAPNKFMGSGMLPAGAYVTLEHEYVLVFRKGGKRVFKSAEEKLLRRRSAFFWEERNRWFSDIWLDLKGVPQSINRGGLRVRSGAFPFELAYRLVNMYSVQADLVLDPFAGTGTTVLAAMAGARNSMGIEIDNGFLGPARKNCLGAVKWLNSIIARRLSDHGEFVSQYTSKKGRPKHTSTNYQFPIVTKQESDMRLLCLDSIEAAEDGRIVATHTDLPPLSVEYEDSKTSPKSRRQPLLFDL